MSGSIVHSYDGILLGNKKEQIIDAHNLDRSLGVMLHLKANAKRLHTGFLTSGYQELGREEREVCGYKEVG